MNSFALVASWSGDWEVADLEFKRIGDNWKEELWTSEAFFKQQREYRGPSRSLSKLAPAPLAKKPRQICGLRKARLIGKSWSKN